ncbi:MAG: type II secretion system protein N, partial [Pseudomonadales bacterium]|nr:type II secretion system protein N [Pseudomonadales bacterium]
MTTLTDTLPERLALPLAILFALGALWSVISGAWFFLGGAETDVAVPVAAPTPGPAAPTRGRSPLSAAQIAALNLFGVPRADDPDAAQRIADAPETRLQLELQGVFLADDPDASSVIVAERNRDGRLYRIGDRLPGNAVLVEVLGDRIVLRRAGQLETLKFLDAAPGGAYLADAAEAATPRAAARGTTRGRTGGIGSAPPTD